LRGNREEVSAVLPAHAAGVNQTKVGFVDQYRTLQPTAQALDRTTLAWLRTTLTMGSFGFGMIGFFRALHERAQTPEAARLHHAATRFGESLLLGGIIATSLALASDWKTLRRMESGQLPQPAH